MPSWEASAHAAVLGVEDIIVADITSDVDATEEWSAQP